MRTLYIQLMSLFLFIFALSESNAQQSQQNIEMTIDNVGNAKIEVKMTMTAQQWQNWNATLGNNPAALKRDIERGMQAYFLDDFNLEKDEMNRSFKLRFNAYGVCEIDKRGNWTIDLEQENAQLTKLTESKYMFVSSLAEFGGQLQQNYVINLPERAKDIEVDKNAYGREIFKFKMNAPSSMQAGIGGIMKWIGLFLTIVGLLWIIKNSVKGKLVS